MQNPSKKILFEIPGEKTMIEVIDDILKNNNLLETDEEFLEKTKNHIEPRLMVIKSVAIALFQKKAPEDKITGLLSEHLKVSIEIAQKIIGEIKQTLLPYAKVYTENEELEQKPVGTQTPEEEKKEAFRKAKEALMQKIGASMPEPKKPELPKPADGQGEKKVEITSVEENAKKIAEVRQAPSVPAEPQKAPDPYKEVVE